MKKSLWIAVLVFAADRVTKYLALRLTAPVPLVPGLLQLRLARNTGMAFSLFSGQPVLLGILSLALLAAGIAVLTRYRLGPVSRTGAMLVLGGAAANIADRLLYGSVVDMIEITAFRFAVFNVADMAVTAGCVLLGISLIWIGKEWETRNGTDGTDRHADR